MSVSDRCVCVVLYILILFVRDRNENMVEINSISLLQMRETRKCSSHSWAGWQLLFGVVLHQKRSGVQTEFNKQNEVMNGCME